MGALPVLSASFRQRYDPQPDGTLSPGDGFPPASPLMAILRPLTKFVARDLSPVAKLTATGAAQERWNYELPPMEVTALIIQAYHIEGSAPRDRFPYSLKAVGLVDPAKIRKGGRGLVSDTFDIVP